MIKYIVAHCPKKAKMANVLIRGNIIWLRGTLDGKRHQVSTKKHATKANLDWVNRHKEKLFIELTEVRAISEIFSDYADYVVQSTTARRNQRSNDDVLQKLEVIKQHFGRYRLDEIRPSMLEGWQSGMLKRFHPKTVLNYRSVLSMVLRYAELDGLIHKNPLALIKAPKKPQARPQCYTIDEIKAILSATTGQFRDLLRFNFFCGLRSGELIALKWSKVNFETGTIRIDERILDGETDLPKGDKVRVITMTPQAKDALLAQRMRTGLGEYVWLSDSNEPYNRCDYLDRKFKVVCAEAGVTVGRFYNTRHTFATIMLENGMTESWLIQQMGHFDIKVTREHYIGKLSANFEGLKKIAL